jgi:hypothetical protein
MSSLFGDFPESDGSKTLRGLGYFIIGIFFAVGPAFILYVLLSRAAPPHTVGTLFGVGPDFILNVLRFHATSPDTAWHLSLFAWFASSLWTAHMGLTERLQIPSRLFSLIVFGGHIFFSYAQSPKAAFIVGRNLLLPMLCIWFGSLMRDTWHATNPTSTPFVIFGGWLVLIGIPIISVFLSSQLQ